MTPPARALVLDFDGTILDTEWSEYVTVRAEFEAHGLELPLEHWQQIVGRADHPHWNEWLRTALGRDYDVDTVSFTSVLAQASELGAEGDRRDVSEKDRRARFARADRHTLEILELLVGDREP